MCGRYTTAQPLCVANCDSVAARRRDLFCVVPLEAVTRGHDIARCRQLERFASDDPDLLVDIINGLVADHGLRWAFDHDMTVGIEAVALGLASRTLARAIMGGQRIGMDLCGPSLGDCVAAGNVDLCVLLPLDAGIGRNLDRPILGYTAQA